MIFKAIVHEAEEGGFWAEVPAVPGCATQGENMEELLVNLREAIEGCLSVDIVPPRSDSTSRTRSRWIGGNRAMSHSRYSPGCSDR